jgi:death on curing protein
MTWFPDIERICNLHVDIIKRAGTKAEIRDFALLHSAIERPKASYSGRYLYPTLFTKAAALLHSLCLNHAFTDGNKRTAWASTKLFLYVNGFHLICQAHEAADFMVYVDNHKPNIKEISSWLQKHCQKI